MIVGLQDHGELEMLYLSIEIPFTGSARFSNVIFAFAERKIIFDRDEYASPKSPNTLISRNSQFIEEYFDVLHGSFYASKYDKVFPKARLITYICHPVTRIKRHYNFVKNNENSDAEWFSQDIKSGRLGIVEFAQLDGIRDCYTRHFAGKPLSQFFCIGISEFQEASLALIEKRLDFGLLGVKATAVTEEVLADTSDDENGSDVEIFNAVGEDCSLYTEAVNLFRSHCFKLGL